MEKLEIKIQQKSNEIQEEIHANITKFMANNPDSLSSYQDLTNVLLIRKIAEMEVKYDELIKNTAINNEQNS